jgi:hypothetical protein
MTQREVQGEDNTNWACVQAYAGAKKELAEKGAELAESSNGTVPVVCTPDGGAQTVRLELPKDWMDNITDEELLGNITSAQQNGQ